jgi:hypothetical protein
MEVTLYANKDIVLCLKASCRRPVVIINIQYVRPLMVLTACIPGTLQCLSSLAASLNVVLFISFYALLNNASSIEGYVTYRMGQTQLGSFWSLITNQSNNTRENGKVPVVVDRWQRRRFSETLRLFRDLPPGTEFDTKNIGLDSRYPRWVMNPVPLWYRTGVVPTWEWRSLQAWNRRLKIREHWISYNCLFSCTCPKIDMEDLVCRVFKESAAQS